MHIYDHLPILKEDPILGIPALFNADSNKDKINLGIGSYKDENGNPFVFEAVHDAEVSIVKQRLNKEYSPIVGELGFIEEALKIVFGSDSPCIQEKRIVAAQTIGASGAIRLTCDIMKSCGIKTVYISKPTWSNHHTLLSHEGISIKEYPYYNGLTHQIDFEKMCRTIEEIPSDSAILLQVSCHNPTGCDPSEKEWLILSELIKRKKILPIFDLAYQGLGTGLDEDAFAVRLFSKEHTPIVCVSFAKNFGLYGERVGLIASVLPTSEHHKAVLSHLKLMIRGSYSTPPLHGARIIKTILTTPKLHASWLKQLDEMRGRLQAMRKGLKDALTTLDPGNDYNYYVQGKGFFSSTGLSKEQVLWMRQAYGVYIPEDGRMNNAGMVIKSIPRVAEAIIAAKKQ